MAHALGTVAWADLSVTDVPRVRNFCEAVLGWQASPVGMGDYDDYNMIRAAGANRRQGSVRVG